MSLNNLATTVVLGNLERRVGVVGPLFSGTVPRIESQCLDLWCWASVTQFVLAAFGAMKAQCRIATEHFSCPAHPSRKCCEHSANPACNEIRPLNESLHEQDCLERHVLVRGPLGGLKPRVEDELGSGRPIGLRLLTLGSPHFIVIAGFAKDWLYFQDPNGAGEEVVGAERFYSGLGRPFYKGCRLTNVYWTKKPIRGFKC